MRMRTTSTQRTYRYVRLSLVGVIVLLGISVSTQIVVGGPLASVSAAYYTPARDVFVGSLCAVALALLALSGRSLEQVLLDVAALFAPIIALVPSPVETGDISGVAVACPGEHACVPESYVPGIANGMLSLVVLAVFAIAAALVVARLQETLDRATVVSLGVAAAAVVGMAGWWMLSPATFVPAAHNVAAIVFFVLVATVAALAAWRPVGPTAARGRGLRLAYGMIAGGILAALVVVIVVVVGRAAGVDVVDASPLPLFFLGEAAALLLFAAFWIVQTVEFWNDTDPRLRAAP
jgi:hypothetical protein